MREPEDGGIVGRCAECAGNWPLTAADLADMSWVAAACRNQGARVRWVINEETYAEFERSMPGAIEPPAGRTLFGLPIRIDPIAHRPMIEIIWREDRRDEPA